MVTAGLDGTAWRRYQTDEDAACAHYIDWGHTRREVNQVLTDLDGVELWQDLDQLVAQAGALIDALSRALSPDGPIAASATLAQELTECAVSMHLALGDAYRAMHKARPPD